MALSRAHVLGFKILAMSWRSLDFGGAISRSLLDDDLQV